jgi:hypothetical protein
VVITTRGKLVFVSESFPLPLAHKLTSLVLDAQGGGAMQMTSLPPRSVHSPLTRAATESTVASAAESRTLSGDFVRLFGDCGVMRAAVDAELRAVGK